MPFLVAPYLISLCDAAHQSGFSFGIATRLGTQDSTFDVEATKVISSIVTFSPARESVAIEFLHQFQKIPEIRHLGNIPPTPHRRSLADGALVESVITFQAQSEPSQWAEEVMKVFECPAQPVSVDLKPILDLATEYLSHLLIAGLFRK